MCSNVALSELTVERRALRSGGTSAHVIYAMVVQNDGSIVLAGKEENGGSGYTSTAFFIKVTASGSLDTTFQANSSGTFVGANEFDSLVTTPDGELMAGGTHNSLAVLAKFTAAGAIDTQFGVAGIAATHFGAPNKYGDGSYYAIAYQPDGKIVAAGRGTISNVNVDDFVIDRFLPDGSLSCRSGTFWRPHSGSRAS